MSEPGWTLVLKDIFKMAAQLSVLFLLSINPPPQREAGPFLICSDRSLFSVGVDPLCNDLAYVGG